MTSHLYARPLTIQRADEMTAKNDREEEDTGSVSDNTISSRFGDESVEQRFALTSRRRIRERLPSYDARAAVVGRALACLPAAPVTRSVVERLTTLLSPLVSQRMTFLRDLGRGGFGDVCLMRSHLDGRLEAVKKIPFVSKVPPWSLYSQQNADGSDVPWKEAVREVRALAACQHCPYVVRYYHSWIEPDWLRVLQAVERADDAMKQSSEMVEERSSYANQMSHGFLSHLCRRPSLPTCDGERPSLLAVDKQKRSSEDDEVITGEVRNVAKDVHLASSCSSAYSQNDECSHADTDDCLSNFISDPRAQQPPPSSVFLWPHVLYISMEPVFGETLDVWLQRRNERALVFDRYVRNAAKAASPSRTNHDLRTDAEIDIAKDVVRGLLHVHRQGIIHRDLKPSNIFVTSGDNKHDDTATSLPYRARVHAKLSDFGLASVTGVRDREIPEIFTAEEVGCPSRARAAGSWSGGNASTSAAVSEATKKTANIGTPSYCAPEVAVVGDARKQHDEEERVIYDEKADMYSLGLVLLELFVPFGTAMERARVFEDVRRDGPDRCESFADSFPKATFRRRSEDFSPIRLVQKLLRRDPRDRPSAEETWRIVSKWSRRNSLPGKRNVDGEERYTRLSRAQLIALLKEKDAAIAALVPSESARTQAIQNEQSRFGPHR